MFRVDSEKVGTAVNVAVANELRALRAQRQLSRQALATLAGMGISTVRRFENCERSPDMQQLYQLCRALDVSVREFVSQAMTGIE